MKQTHANIVNHTEKRTRIRVVPAYRNSADMKKYAAAVKNLPCVDKVYINVRTGSILIEHKGGTRDQFKGVFDDIGCILRSAFSLELPTGLRGREKLNLPQAIADLDLRLGLMASPIRLSSLIPLSLGVLAFIQMRRQGVQITGAPWYILAYLSYYTFTRLRKVDQVINSVAENST